MTVSDERLVPVRLRGAWQDRSLDYDAAVQVGEGLVRIAFDAADPKTIEVAIGDLQGAALQDGVLTLHPTSGRPVVLSDSPHLDAVLNRLIATVCQFPSQTLSLRAFGSEGSAPGSDHDRWFEGLMTARRVSAESRTIDTQRRAFDANRLARHAQITREAWAADRFEGAADRRALAAELEETAMPYSRSLLALEAAALGLRSATDDVQFAVWRHWLVRVQETFRSADDVWTAMIPVLADSRGARGALWRRLLRRSSRGGGA